MTLGATSSPGTSRFPIWRRLIGKGEDPGDEVALGDVCNIGHVIIIIWFRSLLFSVVPLLRKASSCVCFQPSNQFSLDSLAQGELFCVGYSAYSFSQVNSGSFFVLVWYRKLWLCRFRPTPSLYTNFKKIISTVMRVLFGAWYRNVFFKSKPL